MGERGPVGKRSTERRRRNKTDSEGNPNEVEVIEVAEPAPGPPEPHFFDTWHPMAADLWNAAVETEPINRFYEATDWALLQMTCETVNRLLQPQAVTTTNEQGDFIVEWIKQPVKGADLKAVHAVLGSLMFDEGSRRRLRMEIERGAAVDKIVAQTAAGVVSDRAALALVKP